jgi:hypothetical protein
LIILAGEKAGLNNSVLSNQIVVGVGLISFPLYLWHWPLLTFVRVLTDNSKAMMIGSILLSILLAWLSYRYIEKPIRYGKHQATKTLALLVAMAVVGISGFAIYQAGGLPARIDDGQQGQLSSRYRSQLAWPESYNRTEACREKYGADQYCLVGDINKHPTAALIGDSHANHFYPGLSEYFKRVNGNLILLGSGGCPPFFAVDRIAKPPAVNLDCYKRTVRLYDFVLYDKSIKTVFIAFHHNLTFKNDYLFEVIKLLE